VKAVKALYLASIWDRNSNSLHGNINQILDHLRDIYRRISPQMMENKEQELRTMIYHAKYLIDQVFNAVKDFVEFVSLAQQPISQRQTIAKAYLVLNKTGCFKQAITEWNRKTDLQKTWIHF
jgi:excinuclease UvrABC ATPase subunit